MAARPMNPCLFCGSGNDARHRRTDKHIGNALTALFWTYNAAVKDASGRVVIVGRQSADQVPTLPLAMVR